MQHGCRTQLLAGPKLHFWRKPKMHFCVVVRGIGQALTDCVLYRLQHTVCLWCLGKSKRCLRNR